MRHAIEHHVKNTMGLIKPTADTECQTLTYRKLKDDIVDECRADIVDQEKERANQVNDIRTARFENELKALSERNANMKEKVKQL